ncbi:hypothetical protein HK101_011462 [Irineochytrium annulatum]|nr:hypothetical protein HK101_011462 [Irineochytrium annulatum]
MPTYTFDSNALDLSSALASHLDPSTRLSTLPADTRPLLERHQPVSLILSVLPQNASPHALRALIEPLARSPTVCVHGEAVAISGLLEVPGKDVGYFTMSLLVGGDLIGRGKGLFAVSVLFEDTGQKTPALWELHQRMRVGDCYLLAGLEPQRVRLEGRRAEEGSSVVTVGTDGAGPEPRMMKLLRFVTGRSEAMEVDRGAAAEVCDALKGVITVDDALHEGGDDGLGEDSVLHDLRELLCEGHSSAAAGAPAGRADRTVVMSYRGVITSVVDPDGGIYELDGLHQLHLLHCPVSSAGRGLRTGTRVRLHSVHMIPLDGVEFVGAGRKAKLVGGRRSAAFVGCLYSTVEVIEYPRGWWVEGERTSDDDEDKNHVDGGGRVPVTVRCVEVRRRAESRRRLKGMSMHEWFLMKGVKDHIHRSFHGWDSPDGGFEGRDLAWSLRAAKALAARCGIMRDESGGAGGGGSAASRLLVALDHAVSCRVARRRPGWPSLIRIRSLLGIHAVRRALATASKVRVGESWFRIMGPRELGMEAGAGVGGRGPVVWVGSIEAREGGGGLRLVDSTGEVEAVVEGPGGQTVVFDGGGTACWALTGFEVVVECFGRSVKEEGKALVRTFVRFEADRCFRLDGGGEGETVALQVGKVVVGRPDDVDGGAGAGGQEEPVGKSSLILHAKHVGPLLMRFRPDGGLVKFGYLHGDGFLADPETGNMIECFADAVTTIGEFTNATAASVWPMLQVGGNYTVHNVLLKGGANEGYFFQFGAGSRIELMDPTRYFGDLDEDVWFAERRDGQPVTVERLIREVTAKWRNTFGVLTEHIITIDGCIQGKDWRPVETPWMLESRIDPEDLFERHGVGCGRFDRNLLIKLGELDQRGGGANGEDNRVLDVYMDMRARQCPLGLLPGSAIRLRRLGLKVSSRGAVYAVATPETSVELLPRSLIQRRPPGLGRRLDAQALSSRRRCRLVDFYRAAASPPGCRTVVEGMDVGKEDDDLAEELVVKGAVVKCTIAHAQEVNFWVQCVFCHQALLLDTMCQNGCNALHAGTSQREGSDGVDECAGMGSWRPGNESRTTGVLKGAAKLMVDDGTFEATIYVENVDSVFQLLGDDDRGARAKVEARLRDARRVRYHNDFWASIAGADAVGGEADFFAPQRNVEDADDGGGVDDAAPSTEEDRKMSDWIGECIKRSCHGRPFLIACRHMASYTLAPLNGGGKWNKGGAHEAAGARDGEPPDVYWNAARVFTIGDLKHRMLRTSEGTTVSMMALPPLHLHAFCVERVNIKVELSRLVKKAQERIERERVGVLD